jgi:polysaccharide deacetylase family protein (PEP-CTERM system associated)
MSRSSPPPPSADPATDRPDPADARTPRVVLSFDVEEHHRIEAAAGLDISPELKAHYAERVGSSTRWILEQLGERGIKATFFIVGELARDNPALVREIHVDGHEVASHGWDHRRILAMTPDEFREDLRRSVDILQQITGEKVCGYRAPTFSITRKTSWAIDVLAETGLLYDSSIFPVRHDRYGIPDAPRVPFIAEGPGGGRIIELPPATLRVGRAILPVGGGGYFRLLPLAVLARGIGQTFGLGEPSVVTLYFHPWEFDPDQPRLSVRGLGRFRTYFGIRGSQPRLAALLDSYRFCRAVDAARQFEGVAHRYDFLLKCKRQHLDAAVSRQMH